MKRELIALFLGLLLSVALIVSPHLVSLRMLSSKNENLQYDNIGLIAEISVSNEEASSDKELIAILEAENSQLENMLRQMSKEKAEIKYVTKTVTKLVPAIPHTQFSILPARYTHYLFDDIPIAHFATSDSEYVFSTDILSLRSTVVIQEDITTVVLEASSSADDVWHPLPVQTTAVKIGKRYPRIAVEPALGVSINTSYAVPQPIITASAIQISKSLDILPVGMSFGPQPNAALMAASYNIGNHLPLTENLWVAGGISTRLSTQDLGLGAIVTVTVKL